MNKKMRSLLNVLTCLLMQKITRETGYFALGYEGKMKFQSYDVWQEFQEKYGQISSN